MSNYTPNRQLSSIRQGLVRSSSAGGGNLDGLPAGKELNELCERLDALPNISQSLPSGEEISGSRAAKSLRGVGVEPQQRHTSLSSVPNLTANPFRPTATVAIYGDLLQVHIPNNKRRPHKLGARRPIARFTAKARRAMLRKLAMLKGVKCGYFVTLTYGHFEFSKDDVKRHLANLRKALTRAYPDHGAFWRLEVKRRKSGLQRGQRVPHFHLLVYGIAPEQLEQLRGFVAATWQRVVGSEKPLRTQVQEIKNRRHAASYVSKYAAKEEAEELEVDEETGELIETSYQYGRRWGTWGNLDFAPYVVVSCDPKDVITMRRTCASLLKSKGLSYWRRLKRMPSEVGWSVFGVGGESFGGWRSWMDSTALRVVLKM